MRPLSCSLVSTRLAWGVVLGLLASASCNTQTITTPTRSLDRPSDLDLFCVEFETKEGGCIPSGDPTSDPQAYLDAYCGATEWRNYTPVATVLPRSACEEGKRRVRRDDYYQKVRQAATLLGRDPNTPCCAADDTACTAVAPTCMYRTELALVSNTVRGEISVADTSLQAPGLSTYGRLASLHGGKPGFGFLPAGSLPLHVRATVPVPPGEAPTTLDGQFAWAVTSNAGSCDLSVVRRQPVANLVARAPACDDSGQTCSTRDCDGESCPKSVQPWIPSGADKKYVAARPGWIEIAPWSRANQRRVVVAFPTCGVVAVVDATDGASAGRIWEAIAFDQKDARNAPKVLTASEIEQLKCPSDCGGDTSPLPPDAMDIPPSGAMKSASYPASVAIDTYGSRLLISDAVGSTVTVVDFDNTKADGAHLLTSVRRVALDFEVRNDGRSAQLGLDAIRVTPRTPAGQFAYVVAKDSSVRVIDLDREVECETNPDARYLLSQAGASLRVLPDDLIESNLRRLSCLPVDKTKTPRSPLATGPGIWLPNASLPRDVGLTHVDTIPCTSSNPNDCAFSANPDESSYVPASAALWVGDFAWILGGGGSVLGVQIADLCPSPSYRACFPEFAALRRLSLLHTRSQALSNPEQLGLPSHPQALTVGPQDRLGNSRRVLSRFDERSDTGPNGPRPDSDTSGLPIITTRLGGSLVSYYTTISEAASNQTRRRLLLPMMTPYYYLPVDPVCDVAIAEQALTLTSPDQNIPAEPTRRPVTTMHFTDPAATSSESWTLGWEAVLNGLGRSSGLLQSDGTLIDLNGLYCNRGVEPGDKLWLTGCYSNSDCPSGTLCKREQTQVSSPGLCMTRDQETQCRALSERLLTDSSNDTAWAASWLRRYLVTKAEQQITATPPLADVTDRLTIEELPEPEFLIERQSCTMADLGKACSDPLFTQPVKPRTGAPGVSCRVTGRDSIGKPSTSCIRQCEFNTDCGSGFVCAHSHFEADERSVLGQLPAARCVRAPLITKGTPWNDGSGWRAMTQDEATSVKIACFPDQLRYEVRGGDSMVVKTDRTPFATLVRRGSDGVCQRPQPADSTFLASRTLQPRIRIGPHNSVADGDIQRCPSVQQGLISHRIPASPEAAQASSCQSLFRNGGTVVLPYGQSEYPIHVVHGQDFYPQPPDLKTEKQGPRLGQPRGGWQWDPICVSNPMDPRCGSDVKRTAGDPWLNREFELFSMLPLTSTTNQCILTGQTEEEYPLNGSEQLSCSGFCRFPGDHTEIQGVRRIHYEHALGNMVLRVPRRLVNTDLPYDDRVKITDNTGKVIDNPGYNPIVWAVPPEGYAVVFSVVGGNQPFTQYAQTSQRDASSGLLAQGLRAAVSGLDGIVYLIDEGRSGSATGLRGQVMRLVGSILDPYFLLR